MTRAKILAVVDDLFFVSKIQSTARQLDMELLEAGDAGTLERRLEGDKPDLIILDLHGRGTAPFDSIRRIKSDPRLRDTPVIAFFSHVHTDLERRAREAGCDAVLSRAEFSKRLPQILLEWSGGEGPSRKSTSRE